MEGSIDELRSEWIRRRLHPLYQGHDPMMAAYDMKGLRFLAIDNSTYEISDAQLAFFRDQVKSRMPLRSEEHTSELQSRGHLVCRLLLEKKKTYILLAYISR